MAASVEDFFAQVESRRHAWPAGRDDLHRHLLYDDVLVEEQLVAPYRELTHRPGLAPVPARWMHTTVMHGGPVDPALIAALGVSAFRGVSSGWAAL